MNPGGAVRALIEPACPEDVAAILDVLNEVTMWLGMRGIEQWAGPAWGEDEITPALARRSAYAARSPANGVIGFMVVDDRADPAFLRAADNPADASYLHHLAVARSWAGHGVGAQLLAAARTIAMRNSRTWLRLDAPRDNPGLRAYYLGQGFTHVRTVRVDGRASGALFQIAAS